MNTHALFVSSVLLTILPAQTQPIAWQNDLAAARQLAAGKHAPLLVVFRCER
jgi:hypothetical protein